MQKVMEKKLWVKKLIYNLCFVLLCVVLEFINFISLDFGIMPKYLFQDFIVFLIMASILTFYNPGKKGWTIWATIFICVQILLNIINYTMYSVFGDVFSISMISLGIEAANSFSFEFLNFGIIALNVLVLVFFYLLRYLGNKKYKDIDIIVKKNKTRNIICVCTLVLSLTVGIVSYSTFSKINKNVQAEESVYFTDVELWDNLTLKLESFKTFGTYGFYVRDISKNLMLDINMSDEQDKEITEYINNTENSKYNNGFSGIAKDDNLMVIMLESFDKFAIDEFTTPFIYNLINGKGDYGSNTLHMNNYHSKNKTNISEQLVIMGSDHSDQQLDYINSRVGIQTPYSLPNLFKGQNYDEVNYFHSYTPSFYGRNKVNKEMGFNNCYFMSDSPIQDKSNSFGDWILDSDFFDSMKDKIIPQNKTFFSFYTTVSTHGSYSTNNYRIQNNKNIIKNNLDEFKYAMKQQGFEVKDDFPLLKELIQFKAFCMDTDTMVKNVFARLKELNILDKTTVVLYADHNCFYNDMHYEIRNVLKSEFYNTDAYNVPLIIYNDSLNKSELTVVENTFCGTYDVYPTICNMFDLTFNSGLTQGYSIFSEDISKSIFVSNNTGMFVENIYSINIKDVYVLNENVTKEEIEDFQKRVKLYYYKQNFIDRIYKYNFFKNSKYYIK